MNLCQSRRGFWGTSHQPSNKHGQNDHDVQKLPHIASHGSFSFPKSIVWHHVVYVMTVNTLPNGAISDTRQAQFVKKCDG